MNDDLLVKYLAGEADEQERLQVEEWLQNERHVQEYRRMERIWTESEQLASSSAVDEHAAWERFSERIRRPEYFVGQWQGGPPVSSQAGLKRPPRALRTWLRTAAALALLLTAGWLGWYVLEKNRPGTVELVSGGEVKEAVLPDGSVVTLNRNSHLSYARKFRGQDRLVSLRGEAFFKVASDRNKPFIISVNDLHVAVTGTSFNIKSRNGLTEVIVETGSVDVSRGGEKVTLQPGEKATSGNREGGLVKQRTSSALYKYYRTNKFVCNATPLQELVDALNEAYGVRILVPDPALQQQTITTIFENESLDRILEVISDTFNITVRYEEKQIILKR